MTATSYLLPSSSAELSLAVELLRQSPIPSVRNLFVQENDSQIVISGSVTSYYHKQLAQEALMPLLGQRELINRVAVVREE